MDRDLLKLYELLEDIEGKLAVIEKERDYYRNQAIELGKKASELEKEVNKLRELIETYETLINKARYSVNNNNIPSSKKLANEIGRLDTEDIYDIIININ
ncbi:MAG: hypothetical protein QXI58_00170 [Candidatus Micrarchaeia archaeon]